MYSTYLLSFGTLLASLALGLYAYMRHRHGYWSRRGVYSPRAGLHWLFGHLTDALLLRSSPPAVLGELHKANPGRELLGLYVLGKPVLLLRGPELVKLVLVRDFAAFADRYFASKRRTDEVGGAGLFSVDNPGWRYLRAKLSPAFTSGKQRQLFGLMLESAANMQAHLRDNVLAGGASLELRSVCTKYTTDVVSSLTFGISTDSFGQPEPEFYLRSREIFSQGIGRTVQLFNNFFFPKLNDHLGFTFLGENEDYFRNIFWESMNAREKSGVKRGDMIDLLLELKNEEQSPEFRFEGDKLLAQAAIFFVAGLETSAITMSFTLLELAKHPEFQSKVREEIRNKIGNEQLTYERISEMSYLQQVVSETLRLHPPAPLLDRVAVQDYKIPGTDIVIEKGTPVYVTLKGIHEDLEYHPEPLKYDPDRFNETRKREIKPCTYMPFGDGPRICIGMRTGILQTMVGLITILSKYEVSLDPNYQNEVSKRAIFMAPSNGIHLYLNRSSVVNQD